MSSDGFCGQIVLHTLYSERDFASLEHVSASAAARDDRKKAMMDSVSAALWLRKFHQRRSQEVPEHKTSSDQLMVVALLTNTEIRMGIDQEAYCCWVLASGHPPCAPECVGPKVCGRAGGSSMHQQS